MNQDILENADATQLFNKQYTYVKRRKYTTLINPTIVSCVTLFILTWQSLQVFIYICTYQNTPASAIALFHYVVHVSQRGRLLFPRVGKTYPARETEPTPHYGTVTLPMPLLQFQINPQPTQVQLAGGEGLPTVRNSLGKVGRGMEIVTGRKWNATPSRKKKSEAVMKSPDKWSILNRCGVKAIIFPRANGCLFLADRAGRVIKVCWPAEGAGVW